MDPITPEPCSPSPNYNANWRIPCAQPEVLDSLRVGERVFIDDGQIGAEVECLDGVGDWLRVTRARPEGDKIRPTKGLNFPDSDIQLPALGEKDLLDLDFVAREADIVGYSFVQSAADMDRLADELEARGAGSPRFRKKYCGWRKRRMCR